MATWSWASAAVGAAAATAIAAVIHGRPRDPTFHLISIELSSFKLNLPLLDVELVLTVHVLPGALDPSSCRVLRLPARLPGLELAHHAKALLAAAVRREMTLRATVDIVGTARVLFWVHPFSVHVESHVVVDPIHLDVIEEESRSETQLLLT
ncbi:unnamed protein product [Spirodela intermedia]|uniref:Uncharacterized protein n=1 Tax=Spirodela intermedia TaxID=51605 RepID=A0A7I8JCY7_SPIIN|nr:unnamed protein product [Spirodela intermedia]CAA6667595.1 unnamed protein product [Spirodela intermedia]